MQWWYIRQLMVCPPLRGDNPRALESGLSPVQVDNHGVTIVYHLHPCGPCILRDTYIVLKLVRALLE